MRLGVNRRSTFTPDLEWAPGVGQFQAAVLTGVRALSAPGYERCLKRQLSEVASPIRTAWRLG